MGQFRIEITANGGHGCDRRSLPGDKLHGRCGRFTCPDCMAYDFVQQLRQKGMTPDIATFRHWPDTDVEVVDDMLKNERTKGKF